MNSISTITSALSSSGLFLSCLSILHLFPTFCVSNHIEYSTSWDCPTNTSQCLAGDKHKVASTSEADSSSYAACQAYQNASCCDADFTQQLAASSVTGIEDNGVIFNWTHCGPISETCEAKLIEIECMYRCSPLMIYFAGDFPSSLNRVPMCSSFCDDWYDACKDDLTCVANWVFEFEYDNSTGENVCPANSTCDTFENVYGSSSQLCNVLWGNSFEYFDDTENPDACLTPLAYESNVEVVEEIFEDCDEPVEYSTLWQCPANASQCLAGDKHKVVATSEADSADYAACQAYQEASCCDAEFTQQLAASDVTGIVDGDTVFNWTHCGGISEECEAKLIEIECMYRCSPLMIYFAGDFPASLNRIPMCSSFCDDWFDACRSDFTCVANWVFDWSYDETTGENVCPEDSECQTFETVYGNSSQLCNVLWGNSFEYFDDRKGGCLTPLEYDSNLDVVEEIFDGCEEPLEYSASWDCPADANQCLAGDKHKSVVTSEADSSDYAACQAYQEASCCDAEFTQQLAASDVTYIEDNGVIFNWTHCGGISEACEEKLIEIECMYRCSPLMIYFAGDFPSSLNRVPMCSSFCDDWYDACKDDFTCVANWVFEFEYDETTGENVCPDDSECQTFETLYGNGTQLCNVLWGNSFEYSFDRHGGCLTPLAYESNLDVVEEIFDDCDEPIEYSTSWECPANTNECLAGDKHNTFVSEFESSQYSECFAYQNASCCDAEFTQQLAASDVTFIQDGDVIFNWTHCGGISKECEAKLIDIECMYRCSPLMIYFAGDFPSSLNRVPMCSGFCDDWYDACKDDFTCVANWVFDWSYDETTGENVCPENSECVTFEEMYGNSTQLCNVLWGNSFEYFDDRKGGCLTPLDYNSNAAVVDDIFSHCQEINYTTDWPCPSDAEQCLEGDKHKTAVSSEAESEDYAACYSYQNASCCDAEFTQQLAASEVTGIEDGGVVFNWTHCGGISEACEAKLVEIECMYRCSPLMIYFAGDFPASLNRVPMCSSFCDDWYDACKSDLTCVQNWIFEFEYDAESGENVCPSNSTCRTFEQLYGNGEQLCNVLWGNSFEYFDDSNGGCITPGAYASNLEVVENIFGECDNDSEGVDKDDELPPGIVVLIVLLVLLFVGAVAGVAYHLWKKGQQNQVQYEVELDDNANKSPR